MDAGCTGASCSNLKVLTNEEAAKCKVPERVSEKWEGCKYLIPIAAPLFGIFLTHSPNRA